MHLKSKFKDRDTDTREIDIAKENPDTMISSPQSKSTPVQQHSVHRATKESTPFDSIPMKLRQTYADRIYCCHMFPEEGVLSDMSDIVLQWDDIADCLNEAFSRPDPANNSREIWQSDTEDDNANGGHCETKASYMRIGKVKIAVYRENRIDGETVRQIFEYMVSNADIERTDCPRPHVLGYDVDTVYDWITAYCYPETRESVRQCIKDRGLGWGNFDVSPAERQRRYFSTSIPALDSEA